MRTQYVPNIIDHQTLYSILYSLYSIVYARHHISMKNMNHSVVQFFCAVICDCRLQYVRVQTADRVRVVWALNTANDSNISHQRFTYTNTPAEVKILFFFFIFSFVFSVFIFPLLFWLHGTGVEVGRWVCAGFYIGRKHIVAHVAYASTQKLTIKQSYISGLHGKGSVSYYDWVRVPLRPHMNDDKWCKRTQWKFVWFRSTFR